MDKYTLEKLKAFASYYVTEPFKLVTNLPKELRRPKIWMYIFSIMFLVSVIQGDRIAVIGSYVLVIIMYFWKEWDSGYFWRKHREKKYGKYYKKE